MNPQFDQSTLQCPNECGALRPFRDNDGHGWECPKCSYFYYTKSDPNE